VGGLELAAGTGVLTGELVATLPAAEVMATDVNPAMVSLGSQRVPAARWEPADAMRLPYPDAQFDLVMCQSGVMSFPDRPAAFAEARRVLRPRAKE
jgi:ubiquinone/menaquinone biosynthesis C-methylase UbiE